MKIILLNSPVKSRLLQAEPSVCTFAGLLQTDWALIRDIQVKSSWGEIDWLVPQYPGCYAMYIHNMVTKRMKLIYIGTASNLCNRLCNHPVFDRKLSFPYETLAKIKIINNGRLELEKKLIKRLKPRLNKTYNGT